MRRPNENTYWVVPDTFLAGEYPGAREPAISVERINAYLDCGMDYFIDLTHTHELAPYAGLLAECAAARGVKVTHQRFAIDDKGVPKSIAQMRDILAALNHALETGRCVYLHCWGGIGRTGTVVGCYLAEALATKGEIGNVNDIVPTSESGVKNADASNAGAVKQLKQLWPQMAKSDRHLHTPETAEQLLWIMDWKR